MTDITESRNNLQEEEFQYRSAVSEATFFKLGSSVNFINKRQYDTHQYLLNGVYSLGAGSTGPDGVFVCLFDLELVGFSMFSGGAGTSGSTIIDLHYLSNGDTDNGTIFNTRPRVETSAVSNSYQLYDVANTTPIIQPTGHGAPIFNKTTFDQGDAIRMDLDSAMNGGRDLSVYIHFRPR